MGRASIKEKKNKYQLAREELGLTREKASDLLEWISSDRLEKIENEKVEVKADEVMQMAAKYKSPELLNYHCSVQCPIGKQIIKPVKMKELSQITLELLDSINQLHIKKDRFVEITVDGEIDDSEEADFLLFQELLHKISLTSSTLDLWYQKEKLNGHGHEDE